MIVVVYSILLAIEVLVIGVLISNAIPYPHNPFWDTLLIRQQSIIFPKRDLQLYALFLCACFGFYTVLMTFKRKHADNPQWREKLNHATGMQGLWVFVELYAGFKILMDNNPAWAQAILYGTLGLSILNKIFWFEWINFTNTIWPRWESWAVSNFSGWRGNALAVVIIFVVIYIPDPQAAVAQYYMGDQFHNWDNSCLGTIYGLYNGLLPGVDLYSRYGFGLPVFLAGLMKLFGGFDYVNVLKSLVGLGIAYYVVWYFILRRWFYSGLLAFAAIILGMRVQMFPMFIIPSIWNSISESLLRFFFDVLFFAFLYKHIITQRKVYLWLASLVVGIGLYHMISTGAYLFFALLAYIATYLLIPSIRPRLIFNKMDYFSLARIIFAAPLTMLVLMWLTVQGHIFSSDFWSSVMDFHLLYANNVNGDYLTPALQNKQFLFVAGGLGCILFYAASILYAFDQIYLKKADQKFLLIIPLGIYGLCMQSYYIETANGYCTFDLPAIFILFFWIDEACRRLSPKKQKQIQLAAVAVSAFLLISTPMFTAYPNLLNLSRNPVVDTNVSIKLEGGGYYFNQLYINFPDWLKLPLNSLGEKDEQLKFEKDFQTDEQLVEYYKKDTAFTKDIDLIRRLTPEGARVPLISSFEVLILSEAKRKPFFYYFPYLSSRQMRTRSFVTSTLYTKPQLMKMIDQIEQAKPPYIFMQRIFLTPQVPMWYGYQFEDCIDLIRYVESHYQPEQIGEYLVAMRRVG